MLRLAGKKLQLHDSHILQFLDGTWIVQAVLQHVRELGFRSVDAASNFSLFKTKTEI
jgi:hypothetical protein